MFSMRVFGEAILFGIRRHQLQRLHPGLPRALPIARLSGELGVLHQRVELLLLAERHSWSNRSPRRMEKPGIKLDWNMLVFVENGIARHRKTEKALRESISKIQASLVPHFR